MLAHKDVSINKKDFCLACLIVIIIYSFDEVFLKKYIIERQLYNQEWCKHVQDGSYI